MTWKSIYEDCIVEEDEVLTLKEIRSNAKRKIEIALMFGDIE